MNNFIFIDGIAFWVVVIFLMVWALVFAVISVGYVRSKNQIKYKDKQLKKLRREYNLLVGEYHKATFKVPSVSGGEE